MNLQLFVFAAAQICLNAVIEIDFRFKNMKLILIISLAF